MEVSSSGRPGVFLDRDGTVIRDPGYLSRSEQIEVLPRVPEALRLFRQHGLTVVVITNQSAVARGLLSESQLEEIHRELKRRLAESGALLDGIYYCPHHPTEGHAPYRISCECRKPNTGLARRAAAELDLELGRSYVVGDQWTDMELAFRIGAKGILISDRRQETADRRRTTAVLGPRSSVFVASDLWEASRWIIGDLGE
ncbi:MAG: HAD family hydrolase [Deltaproteobacteria bacterium]|nr:HAD family hydrolase [Deltaproteobacteria bacterium]